MRLGPDNSDDYAKIFQETLASKKIAGVVNFWNLDAPAPDKYELKNLYEAEKNGCHSVMHTIQSLSGQDNPPVLWLVTGGAQAVNGEASVSFAQTSVWGMSRVIIYEHPELSCRRVDLSAKHSETEISALFNEIVSGASEDEIVYRDDKRYVSRLSTYSLDAALKDAAKAGVKEGIVCQKDATYLVSGGLGALGLMFAEWMATKGAGNIVLLGRSAPTDEKKETIARIERETGVKMVAMQADVSDEKRMAEVIKEVKKTLPELKGIMHTAGILNDGTILSQNSDQFKSTMLPKADGAWVLHDLTKDNDLDFFVLFSSSASVIGSPGQANYAAANGFLDGLAAHRKTQGQAALALSWGPWADVGLAAVEDNRGDRLAASGMGSIPTDKGVEALEKLMPVISTQVGIMPLRLGQWFENYPASAGLPLFSNLAEELKISSEGNKEDENFLEAMQNIKSGEERKEFLDSYIQNKVAQVLRLAPSDIDPRVPFGTMGFDSLMTLEFRNRLEAGFKIKLPATLVWNYPTISVLTPFLAEKTGISLEDQDDNAVVSVAAPTASKKPDSGKAKKRKKISKDQNAKMLNVLNKLKKAASSME